MASVDEVIASINANTDAVTELQARIEASKASAEETFGQAQSLGVERAAAAVAACKDQLEEASAMTAALVNKLGEARSAAEAAKQA
ncbi:hypothetical protein [Glycomyces albidus]|uniref:Uncharacterized protein n=1 Tax=Glycomyces albidus TaxID=2656774 RepID=A0A6L5GFM8_9ACTN|nr:hypothetical protein [Glycomyces albidus]MQM28386.1 hypothetical protein [Glycomyces albidus]